jgi:hypothetical protein
MCLHTPFSLLRSAARTGERTMELFARLPLVDVGSCQPTLPRAIIYGMTVIGVSCDLVNPAPGGATRDGNR